MLVSDFDFDLPEDLIAQHPPAARGSSRMLTLDRRTGACADHLFAELPQLLQPGDLLVLNDSRVLPARLFAIRAGLSTQPNSPAPTGPVEVLLTERLSSPDGHNDWRALVRPAKKVQPGETLLFFEAPPTLEPGSSEPQTHPPPEPGAPSSPAASPQAKVGPSEPQTHPLPIEPDAPSSPAAPPQAKAGPSAPQTPLLTATVLTTGDFGERTLRFDPTPDFLATLERIGHLPLPPYIHREKAQPDTAEDRERYQTVYSQQTGSAAAPTAGLHFTPEVLAELAARGVELAYITLHVGLGTFQPVRVADTRDIRLHAESYTLPASTAEALNRAHREGRRIVAVGTTSTRTLEHLARSFEAAHGPLSAANPLALAPHSGSTSLFLSPPPDGDADFKLVGGLLTNFHLPQSTLLMLVSAFAGREPVLAAYAHAVAARFRFFSYGDCMLLL